MKILLTLDWTSETTEEYVAQIRAVVPDAEVVVTRDAADIAAVLPDVDVIAGWVSANVICHAPRLRWVQHWSAGVDALIANPTVQAKDFVLTNGSGIHAIPITEHILTFLLTFARGFHHAIRVQTHREWRQLPLNQVFELADKTLLLIGVGAIGARTAEVASALGMHVFGVRRDPSQSVPHVAAMFAPSELLAVLPEVDFVVLTTPLTDETRGMIGAAELQAMKSSAYIVNIGRGGTIDEAALIHALQTGQIAGAGLDVFETEPLSKASPLWEMENVIITGHYAGFNPYYHDRAMEIFLDNLRRYRSEQPLRNVVDKQLGY